jgi:hypothetical protein
MSEDSSASVRSLVRVYHGGENEVEGVVGFEDTIRSLAVILGR